jgi:hypothetical protein
MHDDNKETLLASSKSDPPVNQLQGSQKENLENYA